jgi:hypothetical protein
MSRVTRRGALLGSITASIASLFGRRAKADSEGIPFDKMARDMAAERALHKRYAGESAPTSWPPFRFSTPIPSDEEVLAASDQERGQLVHDLVLAAMWAHQVCGTPMKEIRQAVRLLPICDDFYAHYDLLTERFFVACLGRREFGRTWPEPTSVGAGPSDYPLFWRMECIYRRYTLKSTGTHMTWITPSGPMVSIRGWEPLGDTKMVPGQIYTGGYKPRSGSFYAAWPSQLKKAERELDQGRIPMPQLLNLMLALNHWTRGWRTIHDTFTDPGHTIHCMIVDCVKRFYLERGRQASVIRLTPDMAYHLWWWHRAEGYCAETQTLDDWKRQTDQLIGVRVVFDSANFEIA